MGAVRTSCMIAFILMGASFLTLAMGFTGLPRGLAQWIAAQDLSPTALIAALTIFYIILGCFLDGISCVVLTMAIIEPMIRAAGIDLIWFGIFVVVVVEMAQITPPVGFNLFVLQGMTGHQITYIARAAFPFFLLMAVMVALLVMSSQASPRGCRRRCGVSDSGRLPAPAAQATSPVMPSPNQLFDRLLVRRRRERAAPGLAGADFLVTEVAARLAERVQDVRRHFPLGLVLGAHGGRLASRPRGVQHRQPRPGRPQPGHARWLYRSGRGRGRGGAAVRHGPVRPRGQRAGPALGQRPAGHAGAASLLPEAGRPAAPGACRAGRR